jgi:hypothetical protein
MNCWNGINRKDKKYIEKRDLCISELEILEKKYGYNVFMTSCQRKMTLNREINSRQKKISIMEKELEKLKKGVK